MRKDYMKDFKKVEFKFHFFDDKHKFPICFHIKLSIDIQLVRRLLTYRITRISGQMTGIVCLSSPFNGLISHLFKA